MPWRLLVRIGCRATSHREESPPSLWHALDEDAWNKTLHDFTFLEAGLSHDTWWHGDVV